MVVRESSKWLRSVGTNHKPWGPWSSASLCILCDALFLQHIAFLFFDLLEWFLFRTRTSTKKLYYWQIWQNVTFGALIL